MKYAFVSTPNGHVGKCPRLVTGSKWSDKVPTNNWGCPEGLFTESAEYIAKVLHDKSDSLQQAMSRLNFYINRAGDNLSDKDKTRLERAKELLRNSYS